MTFYVCMFYKNAIGQLETLTFETEHDRICRKIFFASGIKNLRNMWCDGSNFYSEKDVDRRVNGFL